MRGCSQGFVYSCSTSFIIIPTILHLSLSKVVQTYCTEEPLIVEPLIVEPLIVEPLIVDPPNKGHNRNNLSIKDAS